MVPKKETQVRYFDIVEDNSNSDKLKTDNKILHTDSQNVITKGSKKNFYKQQERTKWKTNPKLFKKLKSEDEIDSSGVKTAFFKPKTEDTGKKNVPKKETEVRYFDIVEDNANSEQIKTENKILHTDSQNVITKGSKKNFYKQQKRTKWKTNPKLFKKNKSEDGVDSSGVKTAFFKSKMQRKEIYYDYVAEQTEQSKLLLSEEQGFVIPDKGEGSLDIKQREILKKVDITSAAKNFHLTLNFGPYKHCYTRNGRHLLIGGRMGHVAAFDWATKKLHCEMNVMEEITDITWLHNETMYACAQKNWVHIYDNQGSELHCLKRLYYSTALEFLPYHFLLASGSSTGYLSWVDVSIGELIGHYNIKNNDIKAMRQNPANGVLCVGSSNGTVTLWSPKIREPLAKLLCHQAPISALAFDKTGHKLYTAGYESKVKVWDIRKFDTIVEYKRPTPINQIDVSQKGVVALAVGKTCEMYLDDKLYIKQRCEDFIHGLRFCPYDDVLGISTKTSFSSILVPGAGEPNYDAFEVNIMQTKKQRREFEVHSLLEKIPPELITLDPTEIAYVDTEALSDKVEMKKKIFFIKPTQIDFKARRKMKTKKGHIKQVKNKQIVKELVRKEQIQAIKSAKKEIIKSHKEGEAQNVSSEPSALDRFIKK